MGCPQSLGSQEVRPSYGRQKIYPSLSIGLPKLLRAVRQAAEWKHVLSRLGSATSTTHVDI